MEHNAANELNIEVAHAERPLARFPENCEYVDEFVIEQPSLDCAILLGSQFAKMGAKPILECAVLELLKAGFETVDRIDQRLQFLQFLDVRITKNFFKNFCHKSAPHAPGKDGELYLKNRRESTANRAAKVNLR